MDSMSAHSRSTKNNLNLSMKNEPIVVIEHTVCNDTGLDYGPCTHCICALCATTTYSTTIWEGLDESRIRKSVWKLLIQCTECSSSSLFLLPHTEQRRVWVQAMLRMLLLTMVRVPNGVCWGYSSCLRLTAVGEPGAWPPAGPAILSLGQHT